MTLVNNYQVEVTPIDPFKVKITGLRLKKADGSWLSASEQNAGIYSPDGQVPFISVVSPLLNP